MNLTHMHYIIGVDEAGRGPWAGPIVAGGWMAEVSLAGELLCSLHGLDDSKRLSESKREKLFAEIERMQHRNECQYAFSYRDADIIDQIGIREANRQCMQDVLLSLLQFANHDDIIEIYIDGCDNYAFDIGDFEYEFAQKLRTNRSNIYPSSQSENRCDLSEPKNPNGGSHKSPRTIQFVIHGDALVPVISAASIIAKVTRDHIMCDFHEDFPHYGFSSHKGYGTRKHQESLLYYGISPIHRKSYAPVKRLISPTSSL